MRTTIQGFTPLLIAGIVLTSSVSSIYDPPCSSDRGQWELFTYAQANASFPNLGSYTESVSLDGPTFFMDAATDLAITSDGAYMYVALDINCIYRIDMEARTVLTWSGNCGTSGFGCQDGSPTNTEYYAPMYVALLEHVSSADDLPAGVDRYLSVTQSNNEVIGFIDNETRNFSTVAGLCYDTGSSNGDGTPGGVRFNKPISVEKQSSRALLVADSLNHCVRSVDIASWGLSSTFMGVCGSPGNTDGPRDTATLERPVGVTVTDAGVAYVVQQNGAIRMLRGSTVSTLPMSIPADVNKMPLATIGERVFIGDRRHQVLELIDDSELVAVAGKQDDPGFEDGIGDATRLANVQGLRSDGQGRLWVLDYNNRAIRLLKECQEPPYECGSLPQCILDWLSAQDLWIQALVGIATPVTIIAGAIAAVRACVKRDDAPTSTPASGTDKSLISEKSSDLPDESIVEAEPEAEAASAEAEPEGGSNDPEGDADPKQAPSPASRP